MEIAPIFDWKDKHPILIAGPCAAESVDQVMSVALQLKKANIDLFRAGIWKPRTRPGSFEGVGAIGLPWLQRVQKELGLRVTAEAAKATHVELLLKHEIDVIWIGARSTANPFSIQEIAEALKGVDVPVLIKNPTNPDYKLWVGAIERIYNAGIKKIGVIHRGFSAYNDDQYRNKPMWQIPQRLMDDFPNLTFICDNSHICGKRETLRYVAQHALDVRFHGLMTEVHPNPSKAWSDAQQQVTPNQYKELINSLSYRNARKIDLSDHPEINDFRHRIDVIDQEIIELFGSRMELAKAIGYFKKDHNMTIYQPTRWHAIRENMTRIAQQFDLSEDFIIEFLNALHQESILVQEGIMQEDMKKDKGNL